MQSIWKTRPPWSAFAASAMAAASLLAVPAASFAQDDPGQRSYRCTVLGDSSACALPAVAPTDRVDVLTIAGPAARQLMYLGYSADSAIEQAREAGEVPVRRTVRIVTRETSAAQAYQRYLGQPTVAPVSEHILAEAPVAAPVRQAGGNRRGAVAN